MKYQIVNNLPSKSPIVFLFVDEQAPEGIHPKKPGASLWRVSDNQEELLVNLGKESKLTPQSFIATISNLASELNHIEGNALSVQMPPLPFETPLRHLVIGLEQGLYRFDDHKSDKENLPLKSINILCDATTEELANALALNKGLRLTRTLANQPANHCTPTTLAETALELSRTYETLNVKVLDEQQMADLGMNTILAVSRGSDEPARFIEMQHNNGGNDRPFVFVGKGITFDSGGLSLKPPTAMAEMKYDMCGAATVLGLMKTVAELKLPLNVIGLIASSENLPGPNALKPGDVVTSHAKKTIEVLNTDAEGRLVLCDVLSYAEQFSPQAVVDIATLTGAIIIALGHKTNGIMGNNDPLCEALIKAGEASADPAWQLPLNDDYQALIDSNVADMMNISRDGSAGSITAGCFLARFAEKYPWAHIDCAGTAWTPGHNKQASGRPLPLLIQYLLDQPQ